MGAKNNNNGYGNFDYSETYSQDMSRYQTHGPNTGGNNNDYDYSEMAKNQYDFDN